MNLLEHYFVKTDPMLEIKVLVNCMGVEEYNILWYHKSEWDKIQEQGYYMA